jgi:hypothetical protein
MFSRARAWIAPGAVVIWATERTGWATGPAWQPQVAPSSESAAAPSGRLLLGPATTQVPREEVVCETVHDTIREQVPETRTEMVLVTVDVQGHEQEAETTRGPVTVQQARKWCP